MQERFIDRQYQYQPADISVSQVQYLDLAYMTGNRHGLDIFLPNDKNERFPVVVDIYGGGLWLGAKRSFKLNPALRFLEAGFAIVSIDYSLIWQAPFPTQIYEVKAALRWLRANGDNYHLDVDKIALMGESSGAHLAVLAGVSASVDALEARDFGIAPEASEQVKAIIAMYGPYQFDQFVPQFKASGIQPKYAETGTDVSFEGQLFGGKAPSTVPELVQKYNPMTYFSPQMPPILGMAGTADQVVPYQQTQVMIAAATEQIGTRAEICLVQNASHGIYDFMDEAHTKLKLAFLKKYM
ncbi:alpha/beta hydrolase [Weissella diestrammenae]|uniref:Alpha/beta hydrolase n=2 Tax=Weissella diestrammenae TaxID=1162633 RepID=A0A7G9T7J9_9LACO|nr:alpha/beta hydrolase [Weissella diestrammenae]QNN76074.1 alpha/beta hydrolase [Weissella diestrammenae]